MSHLKDSNSGSGNSSANSPRDDIKGPNGSGPNDELCK